MIIAEIGSNHRGSIDLANEYVERLLDTDCVEASIFDADFRHDREVAS